MTVQELIEELKKAPPDAEVYTEGCDCNGDVGSVRIEADRKEILLERSA